MILRSTANHSHLCLPPPDPASLQQGWAMTFTPPHPPSKSLTGPSHGLFLPILSLVLSLGYPAASLICSAPGWVGRSGLANLLLIHLIFFHFILTVQQMYVIIQSVEFRYYSLTHSAKRTLCSTEQCLFLLIQSCEHYYG